MPVDMCIRVPYKSGDSSIIPAGVEAGTLRRLISPWFYAFGKEITRPPEIWRNEEPFDGFAIDLWAAAVILYVMLTGCLPWDQATQEDSRYRIIASGGLSRVLKAWKQEISPKAADLLQNMLREDPRERLSLLEVKNHPWVLLEAATEEEVSELMSREPTV